MNFGTLCNTTININGRSVQMCANSLNSFCCGGLGNFSPGCFGYGFNSMCANPMFGAGVGLGMAAGMMLPGALKLAGECLGWGFNNIIKPPLEFAWNKLIVPAWNNGIKPVFKVIGQGLSWLGGKIADGAKLAWNGIKSLFGKG